MEIIWNIFNDRKHQGNIQTSNKKPIIFVIETQF